MADNRMKENITICYGGAVFAGKREGGHITGEYTMVSDNVAEDGTRTIVLKTVDQTEHIQHAKELTELIAEKLGESESKLMRGLLYDTLIDYRDEVIISMIKDIKGKNKPVRAREGCFRIHIGDGRRHNSHCLELRS